MSHIFSNEEANSASPDQYERFSFKIWFANRDIELRSRYPCSFALLLTRSLMWPGRSPSTLPLLLHAKDLMAARVTRSSHIAENTGQERKRFWCRQVREGAWNVTQP